MKWYNYDKTWINLENVDGFTVSKTTYPNQNDGLSLTFHFGNVSNKINFTPNESDAEFAKIKALMGVNDKTNDWSSGRCC